MILSWVALLTLVFASAGASAHPDVSPKPHVGGIDLAMVSAIGVNELASTEEHLGKRCFVTTATSDVPLAARGGEKGDHRPKTKGANKRDRQQVDAAAKKAGVKDRRGFGRFVEKQKKGRGASENHTFDELVDLALEFEIQGP